MGFRSRSLQLVITGVDVPPDLTRATAAGDDAATDDTAADDDDVVKGAEPNDDDVTVDVDSAGAATIQKPVNGAVTGATSMTTGSTRNGITKSKDDMISISKRLTLAPFILGATAPTATLPTVATPMAVSGLSAAPIPLIPFSVKVPSVAAPIAALIPAPPTTSPVTATNRLKKPSATRPSRSVAPRSIPVTAVAPQIPSRSRPVPRPPVLLPPSHDTNHQSKPLPKGTVCHSMFDVPCQLRSHPLQSVVGLMLLMVLCVCWRRRGGHFVEGDRGEYRRVASRFTADAFTDSLDDDDLDGFVDEDDDGDGDGSYYTNGTTKHTVLELSELDNGRLSLKEVNG